MGVGERNGRVPTRARCPAGSANRGAGPQMSVERAGGSGGLVRRRGVPDYRRPGRSPGSMRGGPTLVRSRHPGTRMGDVLSAGLQCSAVQDEVLTIKSVLLLNRSLRAVAFGIG
jgi:hypothetical protein